MADADPEAARKERLKAALWYTIGQIVDAEGLALDLNATPQYILALTELVSNQLENITHDLESFARHAGRSTINTEDVLLLGRRNEGLADLLSAFVEKEKAEKKEKEKEREKERPKPHFRAPRGRGMGRGKK